MAFLLGLGRAVHADALASGFRPAWRKAEQPLLARYRCLPVVFQPDPQLLEP